MSSLVVFLSHRIFQFKFMLRIGLLGQFGAVPQDEIDEAEH
jgi:hypothetical protein